MKYLLSTYVLKLKFSWFIVANFCFMYIVAVFMIYVPKIFCIKKWKIKLKRGEVICKRPLYGAYRSWSSIHSSKYRLSTPEFLGETCQLWCSWKITVNHKLSRTWLHLRLKQKEERQTSSCIRISMLIPYCQDTHKKLDLVA